MRSTTVAAICAVAALALLRGAEAHSWVACTDYREKNGYFWDPAKCNGYPREAAPWYIVGQPFGANTGYQLQTPVCRPKDVNPTFPVARYAPGQMACLAWSAQNHVNSDLPGGSRWEEDNGVIVEMQPLAGGNWTLAADFGRSSRGFEFNPAFPRPGFQNCPNFDPSGTGRVFPLGDQSATAFCSQCFRLPADIAPGEYVFRWRWHFHTDLVYYTCWDATVGSGAPAPDPTEFVVPTGTAVPPTTPAATTTARRTTTVAPPQVTTTVAPAPPPTTTRTRTTTEQGPTTTRPALTTTAPAPAPTTTTVALPPGSSPVRLGWTLGGFDTHGLSGDVAVHNLGTTAINGYTIRWKVNEGWQSGSGWIWNCNSIAYPSAANNRTATCVVNPGAWNARAAPGGSIRGPGMYLYMQTGQSNGLIGSATSEWSVTVGGATYQVPVPGA